MRRRPGQTATADRVNTAARAGARRHRPARARNASGSALRARATDRPSRPSARGDLGRIGRQIKISRVRVPSKHVIVFVLDPAGGLVVGAVGVHPKLASSGTGGDAELLARARTVAASATGTPGRRVAAAGVGPAAARTGSSPPPAAAAGSRPSGRSRITENARCSWPGAVCAASTVVRARCAAPDSSTSSTRSASRTSVTRLSGDPLSGELAGNQHHRHADAGLRSGSHEHHIRQRRVQVARPERSGLPERVRARERRSRRRGRTRPSRPA